MAPPVTSAEDIQKEAGFRFGKQEFLCPELEAINRCAYSDYQRDKIYLRTSPAMRKSLSRKKRAERRKPSVNEVIECPKPEKCSECGGSQLHSFGRREYRKLVFDLKFTASGVKRWVTKYRTSWYRCWQCKKTFSAESYRNAGPRYGNNLSSWAIYHHVALRQSYEDINSSLNDIFGFSFASVFHQIKPRMAAKHRTTYERLKDKLRCGSLIHADETKVEIKNRAGYVWAFTNMEEVVYMYTPRREGTILEELLVGFTGVLVSDFYTAYDAPQCPQQKCLIHFMHDVNDDVFHHPFDEDLKQLAQKLVGLLKPVIDTIDTFCLKQRHLHKHQEDVTRFYRDLATQTYHSELARKY